MSIAIHGLVADGANVELLTLEPLSPAVPLDPVTLRALSGTSRSTGLVGS